MKHILAVLVLLVAPCVRSANVLCLMGMTSRSNHFWNRSWMVALAQQGHNVTVLSVDYDKQPTPNLHFIHMEGVYEASNTFYDDDTISNSARNDLLSGITLIYDWSTLMCKLELPTNGVKVLNNYPKDFKFDVVIHDFTSSQCLLGFVHKFNNPPLISVSPFNMPPFTVFVSGNPQFPAYVPLLPLSYPSDMTFIQRAVNLFAHGFDRFYRHYIQMPAINQLSKSYFGEDLPDLELIEQTTSITLINSDPSIDIAQPLLPNVIEIAGIHIKAPNITKKLGKLLDILEGEKDVIYFSLGSNIKSEMMTKDRIKMFLDAFSKFPQYNVLWKYEADNLENIPKNVFIQKWMPQNEILSFPRVKLFITHAGLLSTQEAVYHGVPMLGMPVMVDQHQNIHKSVLAGVAEKIDYNTMTTEVIVENIRKILATPSYQTNIKRRQTAFRNKQNTPLETAVFWINHVINNGGAPHFRTVLQQMPIWKLLMLDVIAAIFIMFIVVLVVIKKLIITLYNLFVNPKTEKKKKTN